MRPAAWALLFAAALCATACSRPDGKAAADNGARIFAAAFPDLEGKMQPLKQWQGKVLVLNFWAPWCPPCREEIPEFVKEQAQYRARGVVFVGLALDRKEDVQAFVDEAGIDYPILLGENDAAELAKAAGDRLGGLPFTVILDRKGAIAFSVAGELPREQLDATLKSLM